MLRRRLAFFVLLAALCACSGGGGSSLPATTSAAKPTAPLTTQNVNISILVPSQTTASTLARHPAYVSSQTQSAAVSVNGGAPVVTSLAAGAPGCVTSANGRTCTLTIAAPAANDVFTVKLYSTTNGTGAVLSQGTMSATIVAGMKNTVSLTLNGVPASVMLSLTNATPAQGAKSQTGLTVTIKDASGAAIIGGDPLVSPITLTDSDTTGATAISPAKPLNSPADAANLTVSYDGTPLSAPAVFGATGNGLSSSNVTTATLTPQAPLTTGGFNDYTTYGYDNQRTSFNPNSTAFTPASIANLHLAWQATLQYDYNTQTQPMLATNIPDHAGVLFVGGSGTGNVYAYDALTGNHMWTKSLGVEQFSCNAGDGPTNFGVGGTAVYDRASKSLYVVGNYNPQDNAQAQNTLFHLDASSGAIINSVNFAPNPFGPTELDFSHTSVTLGSNGVAYVGTGATCDISSWRGRVAAISVPDMTLLNTFFPVWNNTSQPWGGGGVWGYGGVSLDAAGNVYTGIGNTDNGSTAHGSIVAPFQKAPAEDSAYGDAFLQISPDLSSVKAANHPIAQNVFGSSGYAGDLDINGTPVLFTPGGVGCDPMAAVQGKSGALYLYDANRIGGGPLSMYQLSPPSYQDEFLGNPAYSPATGLLYTPIPVGAGSLYPPGMMAINPGCGSPSVAWHTTFGPDSDVSASGAARSVPAVSAGGVVFVGTPCFADANGGCTGDLSTTASARAPQAVRKPALCCNPPGNTVGGAVWALDAASGTVLNGGKPLFTTPGVLRMPPTIDGDWVYVIDNGGDLYGLTLDAAYPAIAAKHRSVDARSNQKWEPRPRI